MPYRLRGCAPGVIVCADGWQIGLNDFEIGTYSTSATWWDVAELL